MIAKLSGLVAALAVVGSFVVAGASATGAADPEMQRILAPTGTLRVGLYPGTPTSILPDAQPYGPRGVGYDLGKEVARRLGVPFEPVVFARNAEVHQLRARRARGELILCWFCSSSSASSV
jgi:polar amino acid transport system substrate-binding protein